MFDLKKAIYLTTPRRLTPSSAWHEHIPFGMASVDLLRPNVIVELGTHYGDSYCAFCQAVQELNLSTRCYAIDTWQGDPHSGLYGPEVLEDLRAHHDPIYGSFSRLIQSTFDEASRHFDAETIDLLHIDGYHTYDAVRHDFETWLPKMSRRGVILLHDINVRERDFGVWKLWDELKTQYPHFDFTHGHGVGVLAVGRNYPKAFQRLLDASEDDSAKVRRFFFELGHGLSNRIQQKQLAAERERLALELARLRGEAGAQQQALVDREQQFAQLAAEREQLAEELAQLRVEARVQQQALVEREQQVAHLTAERVDREQHVTQLTAERVEREQHVAQLTVEREQLTHEAAQLQATVQARQQLLADQEKLVSQMCVERARLDQFLRRVDSSLAWHLITRFYALEDKLMPPGTWRRTQYDACISHIKATNFQGKSRSIWKAKDKLDIPQKASH